MATKKGKSDDALDDSPEREVKKRGGKKKTASEMWQEINESVAKDEMNQLKEEVKEKPKRKRRRRRKKVEKVEKDNDSVVAEGEVVAESGIAPEVPEAPEDVPEAPEEVPEAPEEVPEAPESFGEEPIEKVPEAPEAFGEEPIEEVPEAPEAFGEEPIEEVPEAPEAFGEEPTNEGVGFEPINPFEISDVTLPPKEYEPRYEGEMNMDPSKEDNQKVVEPKNSEEPEELEGANKIDKLPENPFEPNDPFAPINDRPLEDKPLEQTDSIPAPEDLPVKDEDVVEDVPDSIEQQSEKIEDIGEYSSNSEENVNLDVGYAVNDLNNDGAEMAAIEEQPGEVVHEAEVIEVEKQPSNVSVEPEETGMESAQVEEFKEEFWDILEQAGITKKILMGIILFIIVGAIVVFYFIFGSFGGGVDSPVIQENKVVEDKEVIVEDVEINENIPPASKADGLITAYILGEEFRTAETPIETVPISNWGTITPIDTGILVGGMYESEELKYSYYVRVLREMSNLYNTDIYGLLDISLDRRAAIEHHIEEMNSLIVEAEGVLAEINLILDNLDAQYEPMLDKRDLYEQQFFAEAEKLNGKEAFTSLETYMDYASNTVRLKGYFSSYNLLAEMFVNSIEALRPRYKDIVTNKEALIKGVHVFDIPDSDINAIIHLSE